MSQGTTKPTKPAQRTTRAGAAPRARGRTVEPRRSRRPLWLLAGLLALVLVGVGAWALNNRSGGTIGGVQTFADLSREHQDGTITYGQTPPVGGPHNAVWQNCGVYQQPIGNEHAVHSLEHGAVWVTYQPDLPADQIQQLETLLRGRGYTLLSPYPGLPSPVVASAWGVQLQLPNASDPRLEQFLAAYIMGPQTPEPGAACTGGTNALAGAAQP